MSLTEQEQKEFWASLALRHTRGLGPRSWKRLLEAYGSAFKAVQDVASWNARNLARPAQAAALREERWREQARLEWDAVRRLGCGVLLHASPLYPQRLREIPDPPLYLYAQGNAELLRSPGIGVVGTRRSSAYGRNAARELCANLSRSGVTIISGLAYGIDRQAHLAGLEGPGSSIAVLGAGLDVNYPSGNADVRALLRQKGLVLTEYPPGANPEPRNFPVRNRIISGLSLGAIVVEASEKSGSMITARQALEQGREVFAVPGPRDSQNHAGCFWLINQGAKLVCSAEDVLRELAPQLAAWSTTASERHLAAHSPLQEQASPQAATSSTAPSIAKDKKRKCPKLDADAQAVVHALGKGDLHIDDLGGHLGWDAAKVSRVLLLLEMQGLVRQLPGMVYSVV